MSGRKNRKLMSKKNKVGQVSKHIPTDEELKVAIQKSKWGKTDLTKFLDVAHKNTIITYFKRQGCFEMLDNISAIFNGVQTYLTYSPSDISSFVIISLFGRACGNFFAAVRLATSGQLAESYAQLRVCLENALYAFYISTKPSLAEIWMNRHESEESKKKCRDTFNMRDMFNSLTSRSDILRKQVEKAYNSCIDFGAHPNERSVFPNIKIIDGSHLAFQLFNVDAGIFEACLLAVVDAALRVVEVFEKIYTSEFKQVNAQERIKSIEEQYRRIAPAVIYDLKNPRE